MKRPYCLKTQGLDIIWCVPSSSGPLPGLFKLCPCDQKWPHPGGHMSFMYINLYRENMKKSSCLTPQGIEP